MDPTPISPQEARIRLRAEVICLRLMLTSPTERFPQWQKCSPHISESHPKPTGPSRTISVWDLVFQILLQRSCRKLRGSQWSFRLYPDVTSKKQSHKAPEPTTETAAEIGTVETSDGGRVQTPEDLRRHNLFTLSAPLTPWAADTSRSDHRSKSDQLSMTLPLPCGAPQGSILGPFFFFFFSKTYMILQCLK